jgi:hypothetical protein
MWRLESCQATTFTGCRKTYGCTRDEPGSVPALTLEHNITRYSAYCCLFALLYFL